MYAIRSYYVKTYQQQVVKNAKTMVEVFLARGYKIVSGGTENHLFLVDLVDKNITRNNFV